MVFACQKRERQFGGDVDKEVTDILTASTFQEQNEEFSMWFCGLRCFAAEQNALCAFCFHLAFLQFLGLPKPEIALSPYFFGLAHFDRILELGEQTGPLQEFFKNFLKMVPIYPRFFSY